jgi:hypothetical protein
MADIFLAPAKVRQKAKNQPEESHVNILCSFCHNPKGISFQTQKEDETILLFLRSTFLGTNLSWMIMTVILIILPPIIAVFLTNSNLGSFNSPELSRFIIVFLLFYYLFILNYGFLNFLTWFYNVFIVTSERIIEINYSDVVVHNMAETKLSHIEDVRYAQSGFVPSFLDSGNIYIQTAGKEENFEVRSVPKPREITNIIEDLIKK